MVWWKQVLRNPSAMATLVPSSKFLAQAMARSINRTDYCVGAQRVIELGPGLGHITQGLIEGGYKDHHIIALELESGLAKMMKTAYPHVHTFTVDARHMNHLLRDLQQLPVHAIVSSLGLRNMPQETIERIMEAAYLATDENGVFVQYTYGNKDPIPAEVLQRTKWVSHKVKKVLYNTPPATIYRYTKS